MQNTQYNGVCYSVATSKMIHNTILVPLIVEIRLILSMSKLFFKSQLCQFA